MEYICGWLRSRSARGQLQAKPERLCFVILVTHPKSYTETTDRRDFGGKPSKWRWGRVLSWKIPDFLAWAEPDTTAFFAFLGYPSTILCAAYWKQFYPNQWYRWKAETLQVCLLLVWRVYDQAFDRYRPWSVPKSGHVAITKIEKLA